MNNYIRIPIFCDNPLTRHFRYKDEFQIYPFSSFYQEIPINALHKPMIFELRYEQSKYTSNSKNVTKIASELNTNIYALNNVTPALNKTTTLISLLTALSNYRFYHYTPQQCWTFQKNEANKDALEKSKWGLKLFTYPELKKEFFVDINSFSSTAEYKEVPKIDHFKYFINPKLEPFSEITLNAETEKLLDIYFNLDDTKRKKINSICRLISNGITLFDTSKSLSFIAFISCIEALTSLEYKKCNK